MRRIKIFKGVEHELEALEQQINDWVQSSGGWIVATTGNIAPQTHFQSSPESFSTSDVLVIVTYELPANGVQQASGVQHD